MTRKSIQLSSCFLLHYPYYLIFVVAVVLVATPRGVIAGSAPSEEEVLLQEGKGEKFTTSSSSSYGTDISFPMHYPWYDIFNDDNNKQQQPHHNHNISFYKEHLQGCFDWNPHGDDEETSNITDKCLAIEKQRLEMNLRQPQSMRNYTKHGYLKIKAPKTLWQLVSNFWSSNNNNNNNRNNQQDDDNHDGQQQQQQQQQYAPPPPHHNNLVPEEFPTGSIYLNHWNSPPLFLNVHNDTLQGGGNLFMDAIQRAVHPVLEGWSRQRLKPVNVYGIRYYTRGSILVPHVDRNPLVISAILCVDQNVDDLQHPGGWPLEIIDHDGIAHNITLEPGEMILYESHSIIHGRPYPLVGNFMANLFFHFEPIGQPLSSPDNRCDDSSLLR